MRHRGELAGTPTPATNHECATSGRSSASDGAAGGVEVEVLGSGAPNYSVRVADGGRRLLVDLSDADVAGAPAAITPPGGVVGGVLTQGYETAAGHMTRLAISLVKGSSYRVAVPDGTTLRVLLTPNGDKGTVAATGPTSQATASTAEAPLGALVRDVRFERAAARDRPLRGTAQRVRPGRRRPRQHPCLLARPDGPPGRCGSS